jgi:hypothetical protein
MIGLPQFADLRMHLDAAQPVNRRIEDDFVSGRKTRSNLNRIAEVMADGHRHKLDAVTADDTDAKALGAEQQSVRRNRYRVANRGQMEVGEDIGSGTQHALRVV